MAHAWPHAAVADLNLVAIDCLADADAPRLSRLAGLPDVAFKHDGQLTKRDVRAMTLARLAPLPGELLWDVGAGSGSIGIEWMRAHPSCRALAIEADAGRQGLIEHNRDALGVPGLQLVRGTAPAALGGLETPDAIFIGGGVTRDGVLDTCWQHLRPGGRLVANAVTLQSEVSLMHWRERHGGELTRIHVAQAQPLGEWPGGGKAFDRLAIKVRNQGEETGLCQHCCAPFHRRVHIGDGWKQHHCRARLPCRSGQPAAEGDGVIGISDPFHHAHSGRKSATER